MSISRASSFGPTLRGLLTAGLVAADGHREQIWCRGGNSFSKNGGTVAQALVCVSDSYQVDINSDVAVEGPSIRGQWRGAPQDEGGGLLKRTVRLEGETPLDYCMYYC